ncbi:Transcriptional regulatory protein ZraR [Fundidesulfovibrio magnetotacticus]|uniref:Transcriptional regulatory protein ZraR n=1 Tax=Fundidesulfovibrio magnetotacticus TaxID=2730080 RepID=A0A6V8LUE7_9BACT|nr:sigma 54-interacting transcriptional regulator [Fundidesulfovibrio magnetotacticus]GFK93739.1 Transcriptional regulatory protein ZraR [Fundidesulfovibrio magnetotacticus]
MPIPPEILASIDLPGVLDGLPLGVAVLDPEGRVITVNSALERLTGISREEARGVPCRHVIRSGLCFRRCPAEGGADTDIVNRNRARIPVRLSAVPVRDALGRELYRLDIVEDLSALREMERRLEEPGGVGGLVGKSPAMERILRLLPAMAQADAPVCVIGETGSGKDSVAEAIHKLSPRSREPFVRVGCGPTPPQTLEAELFGRRAASGEIVPGALQRAGAGTVYLSDVGDLPEELQVRLVRLLDEGVAVPAGGSAPLRCQARVLASSGASPEELTRLGRLRQDLAYRLGALRVDLPPLRERPEDIEFLLAHFLEVFAAKFRKDVRSFTPKARRLLLAHDYPGNVRELRNIVEFAVMVCTKPAIPPACLPAHLLGLLGQGGEE